MKRIAILPLLFLMGCGQQIDSPNLPAADLKGNKVTDDDTYSNPVDGKKYVAEGGWSTHQPQSEISQKPSGRIKTSGLRLLTAQDEIANRTSVEALASFAKLVEKSAQDSFETLTEKSTVMSQFTCTKGEHSIQIAHQGPVAQEQLQDFHDKLQQLDPLPVTGGEVSFQLTIEIDAIDR